jgi:hypothetical protein
MSGRMTFQSAASHPIRRTLRGDIERTGGEERARSLNYTPADGATQSGTFIADGAAIKLVRERLAFRVDSNIT